MLKRIALMLAFATLLSGCDGKQVTPAMVATAASNMIAGAINGPQGVQVGWTYAQVVAFQGRPQRIYGAGTPVMVYPIPNSNELTQRIGIDGLDNTSKVLWIKTFNNVNQIVKT